jgi:hypothetical protein
MANFIKGDLVCHQRLADAGWESNDEDRQVGHVTGFCPGSEWVRVKTLNGRHHIWAKSNIHNVDADLKEGNHAPEGVKGA